MDSNKVTENIRNLSGTASILYPSQAKGLGRVF